MVRNTVQTEKGVEKQQGVLKVGYNVKFLPLFDSVDKPSTLTRRIGCGSFKYIIRYLGADSIAALVIELLKGVVTT